VDAATGICERQDYETERWAAVDWEQVGSENFGKTETLGFENDRFAVKRRRRGRKELAIFQDSAQNDRADTFETHLNVAADEINRMIPNFYRESKHQISKEQNIHPKNK
jgi:hypothetical protein